MPRVLAPGTLNIANTGRAKEVLHFQRTLLPTPRCVVSQVQSSFYVPLVSHIDPYENIFFCQRFFSPEDDSLIPRFIGTKIFNPTL